MTTAFRAPRGTNDWYGGRARVRRRVVEAARRLFEHAGYTEVITPTFEDTGVFSRTAGESSDVVTKEMYSFHDRSDRPITLRPESTAPVMRAYLEHGMSRLPQPVKQWYCQSHFRYNAVQRGRYREHYQVGLEVIGSDDPALDAEAIALQAAWYAAVGADALRLELNSIGDRTCRPAYTELLVAFLDANAGELCDECRERRRTNPLRVFDCKQPGCQALVAAAPMISDHLCTDCAQHMAGVRAFLDARGVTYTLNPLLVRGLDYYTRTTWEYSWPELGAQSGVGGGGRYDGLAEQLGGPPTPGVGFGAGVERLVLALEDMGLASEETDGLDVWFAVIEDAARPRLYALMDAMRAAGRVCDAAYGGRRLKRALELASRRGAAVVVIVGADEWERGVATVRDMNTGEQRELPLDDLVRELS